MVYKNRLIVTPQDSELIYAYDTETGARVWEKPRVMAQDASDSRNVGANNPPPQSSYRHVLGLVNGALLLTGTPLGLPALIGLLMLVGIVVTNAIVLIDLVNQYRKRGMDVQAAVVEGGRRRLRPILMTALATVFAMVPMALGGSGEGGFIGKPLALVVIGGLLLATVATTDGALQVTYSGKALYWYSKDKAAGQVHGNLTNKWGKWSTVVTASSGSGSGNTNGNTNNNNDNSNAGTGGTAF